MGRKEDLEFLSLAMSQLDEEEDESRQIMGDDGVLRNFVPEEDKSIPRQVGEKAVSVQNATAKGLLTGTSRLGRTLGPLLGPLDKEFDPSSIQGLLDQFLPSQEGILEDVSNKAAEIFPSVAVGGGSQAEKIARSTIAAMLGETAEKVGAPPIIQSLAENAALVAPRLGRKIQPKNAEQKKLIDFANEQGLTDKQIAPLLQEESTLKNFLARITPRGGRTKRALEDSKKGNKQLFEALKSDPATKNHLNGVEQAELFNGIAEKMRKMSRSQRERIEGDYADLIGSKGTVEDVVDFYRKVNSEFDTRKEADILQTIKDPVSKALRKNNPKFADKFNLTNDLSSRYYSINRRLKSTPITQGIEIASALRSTGQGLYGLVTGNVGFIAELIGENAARIVGREMLINPRFQNLSKQMVNAAKNNKLGVVSSLHNQMTRQLRKQGLDQETIDKFQDITEKDLKEFIDLFKEQEKKVNE